MVRSKLIVSSIIMGVLVCSYIYAQEPLAEDSLGFVFKNETGDFSVKMGDSSVIKLLDDAALARYENLPVRIYNIATDSPVLESPLNLWKSRVSAIGDDYSLDIPFTTTVLDEKSSQISQTYNEILNESGQEAESMRISFTKLLKENVREVLLNSESASAADVAFISNYRDLYINPNSTLKSYEGVLDSTPERYREVATKSDGVVLIQYMNSRRGTGFLVEKDKIITALHVVKGRPAKQLSVIFDYEEDVKGQLHNGIMCSVTMKKESSDPSLDLALLIVDCPDSLPESDLQSRVLNMADSTSLLLDDPLYVISHVGGNHQIISDRNFLRFPHELDNATYASIEQSIIRQFLRNSFQHENFQKSYVNAGSGFYKYQSSSRNWNIPGREYLIPTFGFVSNTAPGSSGAPVFSAYSNLVVGILYAGAKDYAQQGEASWMRHEAAIPAEYIKQWYENLGP